MSYEEYFDIYKTAQSKKCPYRAFLIDVCHSKTVFKDSPAKSIKLLKLFDYISLELLKKNVKTQVFRNDELNGLNLALKDLGLKGYYFEKYEETMKRAKFLKDDKNPFGNLISNPMITGDAACYLTNENTLTDEEFLDIVYDGIKKFDIDFDFHYLNAKYETDDYAEGGKKLYKGYVFPILEKLSKTQGKTIKGNLQNEL